MRTGKYTSRKSGIRNQVSVINQLRNLYLFILIIRIVFTKYQNKESKSDEIYKL